MVGIGDLLYHTPLIRYLSGTFKGLEVGKLPTPLRHQSPHTVDFCSVTAIRVQFFKADRELEFFISGRARAEAALALHGIKRPVALHPATGWKSRTLPERFYESLVHYLLGKGYTPVLVGKEVRPNYVKSEELNKAEVKGLHDGQWRKLCFDLTNRLSLEETAAVLDKCKFAVLSETGLMPLASCTGVPFVYVPQLMPPEYRLNWRNGENWGGVECVRRLGKYPSQD